MYKQFLVHDPVACVEGVIVDFDRETLEKCQSDGYVFIGVDENGERSVVPIDEVQEPPEEKQSYVFIQPEYVDTRTKATVAVFDAMVAVLSGEDAIALASTDEEPADPMERLTQALDELRALEG